MNLVRKSKLLYVYMIVILVAIGINYKNVFAEYDKVPYKIEIETKIDDNGEKRLIHGKTIHRIDLLNNIIYTHTEGDLGGIDVYYKIKGEKVDMYYKENDMDKYEFLGDISINETPIRNILNLTRLENNDGNKVSLSIEADKLKKCENEIVSLEKNTLNLNTLNKSNEKVKEDIDEMVQDVSRIKVEKNNEGSIKRAVLDLSSAKELLENNSENSVLIHSINYDYNYYQDLKSDIKKLSID